MSDITAYIEKLENTLREIKASVIESDSNGLLFPGARGPIIKLIDDCNIGERQGLTVTEKIVKVASLTGSKERQLNLLNHIYNTIVHSKGQRHADIWLDNKLSEELNIAYKQEQMEEGKQC